MRRMSWALAGQIALWWLAADVVLVLLLARAGRVWPAEEGMGEEGMGEEGMGAALSGGGGCVMGMHVPGRGR